MTGDEIAEFGQQLDRDGICVIPAFRPREWCDQIRREVEELLNNGELEEAGSELSYQDMATADQPLLNRRGSGGRDEGMLDIFNVSKAIPEIGNVSQSAQVKSVIDESALESVSLTSTNIYVNRSVTNTRGFHADSYAGQFKAFIYLTDVQSLEYGPYTYIPGSHRPSIFTRVTRRIVNRVRGNPGTDALLAHRGDAKHCTGQAGSLILSNQSGLHRGWPQEEGYSRMLISLSFGP